MAQVTDTYRRTTPQSALPRAGHKFLHLINDVVSARLTRAQIADRWGCTESELDAWCSNHCFDIDTARTDPSGPDALLWVQSKTDRTWDIQEVIEILADYIRSCKVPDIDAIRAYASLFKQVSEELGQLPPRQQVVSARVDHVIAGVAADELDELLTGRSGEQRSLSGEENPGQRELSSEGHDRPALPGVVLELHDASDSSDPIDNAIPLRRGSGPEPGRD